MLTRFLPSCLQSKLELAVSSHGLHRSESRASLQPVVSLECRHIGQKIAERVTVRSTAKKIIAMTCNRSIDLLFWVFLITFYVQWSFFVVFTKNVWVSFNKTDSCLSLSKAALLLHGHKTGHRGHHDTCHMHQPL